MRRLGKLDQAMEAYNQAEELYQKEQEPMGLSYTLARKYLCLRTLGQPGEAEKLLPELQALLPTLPSPVQEQIQDILANAGKSSGFRRLISKVRDMFRR